VWNCDAGVVGAGLRDRRWSDVMVDALCSVSCEEEAGEAGAWREKRRLGRTGHQQSSIRSSAPGSEEAGLEFDRQKFCTLAVIGDSLPSPSFELSVGNEGQHVHEIHRWQVSGSREGSLCTHPLAAYANGRHQGPGE
jgi:hypothetical protein